MKLTVSLFTLCSVLFCGIYSCSKSTPSSQNHQKDNDPPPSHNDGSSDEDKYLNNPDFIRFDSTQLTLTLDVNGGQYIPKKLIQNTYTKNIGILAFSVEDTTIAQIISDGSSKNSTVRGLRIGKTTLTASIINTKYKATCSLNIIGDPARNSAISLKLGVHDTTLTVGDSLQLPVTVSPSNTNLFWSASSSSASVVNGLVKAVRSGVVQIKVYDYLGKTIDVCNITINDKVYEPQIKIENPTITMNIGDNVQIKAKATNDKGKEETIRYTCFDSYVATVSSLGIVSAIAAGDATVTLQSVGLTKTVKVHVNPSLAQSIALNKNIINVVYPTTTSGSLLGTISPFNASNKKIDWRSQNSSVSISPNSTFSGEAVSLLYSNNIQPNNNNLSNLLGTTQIVATSNDGGASAYCTVNFIESFDWTGKRLANLFLKTLEYYHDKAHQLDSKGKTIYENYSIADSKLPRNLSGDLDFDLVTYIFRSIYSSQPSTFTLYSLYGLMDSPNSSTMHPSNFDIRIEFYNTFWSFSVGNSSNYIKHTYQFSDKVSFNDIKTLIDNAFQSANK